MRGGVLNDRGRMTLFSADGNRSDSSELHLSRVGASQSF